MFRHTVSAVCWNLTLSLEDWVGRNLSDFWSSEVGSLKGNEAEVRPPGSPDWILVTLTAKKAQNALTPGSCFIMWHLGSLAGRQCIHRNRHFDFETELCVNKKKSAFLCVAASITQSRKMDWTTQTPRTQEESYVAVLGLVYKLGYPSDGFCSPK